MPLVPLGGQSRPPMPCPAAPFFPAAAAPRVVFPSPLTPVVPIYFIPLLRLCWALRLPPGEVYIYTTLFSFRLPQQAVAAPFGQGLFGSADSTHPLPLSPFAPGMIITSRCTWLSPPNSHLLLLYGFVFDGRFPGPVAWISFQRAGDRVRLDTFTLTLPQCGSGLGYFFFFVDIVISHPPPRRDAFFSYNPPRRPFFQASKGPVPS